MILRRGGRTTIAKSSHRQATFFPQAGGIPDPCDYETGKEGCRIFGRSPSAPNLILLRLAHVQFSLRLHVGLNENPAKEHEIERTPGTYDASTRPDLSLANPRMKFDQSFVSKGKGIGVCGGWCWARCTHQYFEVALGVNLEFVA